MTSTVRVNTPIHSHLDDDYFSCVFTGESAALKDQLQNPHLRDILTNLDQAKNPGKAVEKLMREPLFEEFVDECLKVVEPEKEQETSSMDFDFEWFLSEKRLNEEIAWMIENCMWNYEPVEKSWMSVWTLGKRNGNRN